MSEKPPSPVYYSWYKQRVIESAGGDTELTCKRCGYQVTITPRLGDDWPSVCPKCRFDDGGQHVSISKE
jgi:hypothetical protein